MANFLFQTRSIAEEALAYVKSLIGQTEGGTIEAAHYTQFEYTPRGTGVLTGPDMIEQTESAINALGNYTYATRVISAEALNQSTQAKASAQAAVETANGASASATAAASAAQSALSEATAAGESAAAARRAAETAATGAEGSAAQAAQAARQAALAEQAAAEARDMAVAGGGSASSAQAAAESAARSAASAQAQAEQAATNAANAVTSAAGAQDEAARAASEAARLALPSRYALRSTDAILTPGQTISLSTLDENTAQVGNRIIDGNGDIFTVAAVDTDAATCTLKSAEATDPGKWISPALRTNGQILTPTERAQVLATIGGMAPATATDAGGSGLVPAPAAGDEGKVLTGAGTWQAVYTQAEVDQIIQGLEGRISALEGAGA